MDHAPRNDQWDRIKDRLPGRAGAIGLRANDDRLFVEAVLHRYRTGVPWRDPPERFGRWAKSGVWRRVFKHLAMDADNE